MTDYCPMYFYPIHINPVCGKCDWNAYCPNGEDILCSVCGSVVSKVSEGVLMNPEVEAGKEAP